MSSVDERVVAMKLNNAQFEQNAKQSLGTLGTLAKALKLDGASKGLENVSAAAKNANLGNLAQSVDSIASKFTAMGVIGVTALANIANKAVNAGISMAKSLTIDPIKSGFDEYELKMGSIQTILSNTARYGTKLSTVTKNLDALNNYADKTIYNFGDMTRNIGLFTNAGIRVGEATKMIQGFSNEAAASGTSAQGAASAAYQLSQALSAGKITLMDWRSLQNVGMGNKNMQNGLIEIASAMGTLNKHGTSAKKIQSDFNGSLQKGWLEAKVMSKYLKIMATDNEKVNRAQLKSIGITGKQADAFILQQKNAAEAATKVRTFTQLVGTIRESVGSSWTDTWDILIGDFNKATKLWTDVNNSLGKTIGAIGDARNNLLKGWAKLGGREVLIEGLKNAFQALGLVIKAVKDGFRAVFPPATAKQLFDMTKNFRDFTASLKMGGPTADRLKRTFAGIFSIFKIGYTIVSSVVKAFFNLFGVAQGGAGGFLALTAAVGDFLVKIQTWLTSNKQLKSFFSTIDTARAAVLVPLLAIVGHVSEAFAALFKGDKTEFVAKIKEAFAGFAPLIDSVTGQFTGFLGKIRDATGIASEFLKSLGIKALEPIQRMLAMVSENFGKVKDAIQGIGFDIFSKGADGAKGAMSGLSAVGQRVADVWGAIKKTFSGVTEAIGPIGDSIGKLFKTITDKITQFISGMDMQDALAVVNTAFFIMMYKAIRDFMKDLKDLTGSFKGIADSISGTFDTLKDTLTSFSDSIDKNVKINAILKIAIALGILALSLKLISTIDPAKLAMSLAAVGAMLFAMTKAMGSMMGMLDTVEGEAPKKVGSVLAAGGALVLLAGAILILSFAVKNIASLSWAEMAKGLIGTAVLLGALGLFTKFADMESPSIKSAAALALLAGAIYLLTVSVSKLGKMDTGQLIQGGVAVTAILGVLTAVSRLMGDPQSIKGAAGIVLMAGALAILTPVIIGLGLVPYENLAKGLGTIGLALLMLAGASKIMGQPDTIAGAVGIVALAGAMMMLTPVILALGHADLTTLAKGLGTVAIALGLLAAASIVMGNPMALAGAVGILAMAGALQMLTPVILLLGQADLKTLALGLGAIAVGFGILIVAGAAAMVVAPGLAALGTAVALLGAGMLAAGLGFLAFSAGFTALVAVGTAGFAVLTTGFMGLLNLIPLMAQQVGLGIIAIAVVISGAGPRIIQAITVVLISFLKAIQNAAPQFFSTMATLIMGLVLTIARLVPQIAAAGAGMILRLLTVIQAYVPQFITKATNIMIALIQGIANNAVRLANAGMDAIIKLINGIAGAIRSHQNEMDAAGRNLADAIVQGMIRGITAGVRGVVDAAKGMAKSALDAARNLLGIHSPSREFAKLGKFSGEGFAKGLTGSKADIDKAMSYMKSLLSDTMQAIAKDVSDAQKKLNKLTSARKKDAAAIREARKELAAAKAEQKKVWAANSLVKTFGDEQKKLGALSNQYDTITEKLKSANQALADAKKTRDDFAKSITDQYSNLPDISADTKLGDFVSSLEKQVADTKIFAAQLQQLRKMGLSDAMYKELLSKGTAAIPFAEQLLAGGKNSITQINTLGSSLESAAKSLGSTASTALYQAAVDSAAGLVKGLENQQKNIEKQMDKIADAMVKAIKKKLGIKSPSREFMKVGNWSVEGLAKGFEQTSSVSEKAAENVGHSTIDALRKTIGGLSDAVTSDIDVNPTIRPVIDLTEIKKGAGQIGGLLGGNNLAVGSSYSKAAAISNEYAAAKDIASRIAEKKGDVNVSLTQNIHSPKAVSRVEVYRQTNNQLSTLKEVLKK